MFHPISCLKQNIANIYSNLSGWCSWSQVSQEELEHTPWEEKSPLTINFLNFSVLITDQLPIFHNDVLTLFSSPKILHINGFLKRVSICIDQFVENLKSILIYKKEAFETKSLRSRQRAKYQKLLCFVPDFVHKSRYILISLLICYHSLGIFQFLSETKFNQLIKLFKKMLKFCENLVSNSSFSINKFDDSITLIDNSIDVCASIFNSLENECRTYFND